MHDVRVRFPPSPTGYFHVGSSRTAVYNWLFARKKGGKLILRIEDTDPERSTRESIDSILDGLAWLGISWDEGPYFQSAHAEEHLHAANRLLASGDAYKCFYTPEELERSQRKTRKNRLSVHYDERCRCLSPDEVDRLEKQDRPYAVRFKVPRDPGAVIFEDGVYGVIEKKYQDIEDFAIVRSNGQPLYILSNVVDDIRDRITHVIRGQDHLANTPKQILIYQALGATIPQFAHLPLVLDSQKSKISKRTHGEVVSVQFYKDHGFLPWALVNFLVLLGWSTSDDREIFSKEELIEAFSLEGLNRANPVFDIRQGDPKFFTDPKALSINRHYLRKLPVEELLPYVKAELEAADIWDPAFAGEKRAWFASTVELIRSRYHTTKDFVNPGRAYFADDFPIDEKAFKESICAYEEFQEWLPLVAGRLADLEKFDPGSLENVIRGFAAEMGIRSGVLMGGIRVAVTGQKVGPGLFDVLAAIGKERVVQRLQAASRLFAEAKAETSKMINSEEPGLERADV